MLIYYGLLGGLLLAGVPLCSLKTDRRRAGLFALLAAAALTAVSGMRYMVGWDYPAYAKLYAQSAFFDWPEFMARREEKGYLTLNWLLSSYSIDFGILFWAVAAAVAVSVMLYVWRYSSNYWLSAFAFVAFGFLYNSMCFMRQILAAMVIMWALRYVEERRFWRYAVLVLLASCFHISALVMLPLYFLLLIPLNKAVLAVYLAGSALCYVFSTQIIGLVTRFYYSSYGLNNEHVLDTLPIGYTVGFALLFLFCWLVRRELIGRSRHNGTLLNCLFFGTLFEFIGSKHSIISRLAVLLLIPAVVVLVSEAAAVWAEKLRHRFDPRFQKYVPLLVCLALAALMLFFHQYLLANNYNGVVPYKTS